MDEARNADKIDEKSFLFLRTHKVVLDSLMDITKGDYARFNSNTYLEVYKDIRSKSLKQYRDEVSAHEETRQKLKDVEENAAGEKIRNEETISELRNRITALEEKEKQQEHEFEKKIHFWGWGITIIFAGIPYLLLSVGIEVAKTQFSDISWRSAYGIAGAIIVTGIVGVFFNKGKNGVSE